MPASSNLPAPITTMADHARHILTTGDPGLDPLDAAFCLALSELDQRGPLLPIRLDALGAQLCDQLMNALTASQQ